MIAIAERKELYHGECWHERTKNLCCSWNLPVDVSATDRHISRVDSVLFVLVRRRQNDAFPIETEPGKAKTEVFYSA